MWAGAFDRLRPSETSRIAAYLPESQTLLSGKQNGRILT
jgi:hypothetical protein